jgi:hypothetical protein
MADVASAMQTDEPHREDIEAPAQRVRLGRSVVVRRQGLEP